MSDRGLQYYQQLGQQEQEKAELMEMYQKMLSNEEFLKEYNKILDEKYECPYCGTQFDDHLFECCGEYGHGELIGDNNG